MKHLLWVMLFSPVLAQTATSPAPPVTWKASEQRIFSDDPRMGRVQVETSWATTSANDGLLRYKVEITARPLPQEHNPAARIEKFYDRITTCLFTLKLADGDGFNVAALPLAFVAQMNDTGKTSSVTANSQQTISIADYNRFWGHDDSATHGKWSLGKSCPVVVK